MIRTRRGLQLQNRIFALLVLRGDFNCKIEHLHDISTRRGLQLQNRIFELLVLGGDFNCKIELALLVLEDDLVSNV